MFCCIIMCIFLTNVLQNLRERISEKLLDGGTRHGYYPGIHRHASEMSFKFFRCCKAKKEERKAGEGVCVCGGGGVGDRLESPVETHSIVAFFTFFGMWCCCFCMVGGGGGKLLI